MVVAGDLMLDVLFAPVAGLHVRAGGSAANVAVALAARGQTVTAVGRTGADPNGRWLRETLAAAGVDCPVPPALERATGFLVLHRHGADDRVVYVERGANRLPAPDEAAVRSLDGATWLHVSGYGLLEPGPGETARRLAGEARKRGIPVSVDAGVPRAYPGLGAEGCAALLKLGLDPGPSLLILSTAMAAHIGSPTGFGAVVVTDGPAGAWVDGERIDLDTGAARPAADVSGAGDSFVAGLIRATLGGLALADAVRGANAEAAQYVALSLDLTAEGSGWRRVAHQAAPVLISACLFDTASAYDGRPRPRPAAVGDGSPATRLYLPICPEQAAGLGTPRPPAEIQGGASAFPAVGAAAGTAAGGGPATGASVIAGRAGVVTREGQDVTGAFLKGARRAVELARATAATEAILKEGSPSCGPSRIADGTFSGRTVLGEGLTVTALRRLGVDVRSESGE